MACQRLQIRSYWLVNMIGQDQTVDWRWVHFTTKFEELKMLGTLPGTSWPTTIDVVATSLTMMVTAFTTQTETPTCSKGDSWGLFSTGGSWVQSCSYFNRGVPFVMCCFFFATLILSCFSPLPYNSFSMTGRKSPHVLPAVACKFLNPIVLTLIISVRDIQSLHHPSTGPQPEWLTDEYRNKRAQS